MSQYPGSSPNRSLSIKSIWVLLYLLVLLSFSNLKLHCFLERSPDSVGEWNQDISLEFCLSGATMISEKRSYCHSGPRWFSTAWSLCFFHEHEITWSDCQVSHWWPDWKIETTLVVGGWVSLCSSDCAALDVFGFPFRIGDFCSMSIKISDRHNI